LLRERPRFRRPRTFDAGDLFVDPDGGFPLILLREEARGIEAGFVVPEELTAVAPAFVEDIVVGGDGLGAARKLAAVEGNDRPVRRIRSMVCPGGSSLYFETTPCMIKAWNSLDLFSWQ
jgi:hypothetical protein